MLCQLEARKAKPFPIFAGCEELSTVILGQVIIILDYSGDYRLVSKVGREIVTVLAGIIQQPVLDRFGILD